MRSELIETNGIRLHVVDHGGRGPTLILTPGLTANARFFDAIVSDGLGVGVRVLAVDLRGRGLSDKPDSRYTMADHSRDILGLLDALGLEQVILGGHSFGGLLTYFFAARHPGRVSKCVVLDAPGEIDPTIVEQIRPSLARLESTAPSFEQYVDVVRSQPYFDGWWDPRIETYYRADVEDLPDGSVRPRSKPDHIQQAIDGTLNVDWSRVVRLVTVPTLLIRATGSFGPHGYPPILPAEVGARTVSALPDGRMVEVDGNHITAFYGTGSPRVAAAIRSFILEET
jgi:pimeloyl-ACP methyl ester carboxylesterase